MPGKVAVLPSVRYNACRAAGATDQEYDMLEELIHKAHSEFERIQRLRGYL